MLEAEKFGKSDGFAVAAAFWGTGVHNVIEDPEIGQLKFYLKWWDNPSEIPKFRQLASRDCNEADFDSTNG